MECNSFWTAFDSMVTAIKDLSITWTAIGSIATVFGASAIIFAARQLRYNAWLKAQEVFTSDEFTKARTELFKHFDDEAEPWPDPIFDDANLVCRKMDEMAHLTRYVGACRVLKGWGNPIAKAWLLLKPTMIEAREKSHWEKKWRAFEKLGKKAVRRNRKLAKSRKKYEAELKKKHEAEWRKKFDAL